MHPYKYDLIVSICITVYTDIYMNECTKYDVRVFLLAYILQPLYNYLCCLYLEQVLQGRHILSGYKYPAQRDHQT